MTWSWTYKIIFVFKSLSSWQNGCEATSLSITCAWEIILRQLTQKLICFIKKLYMNFSKMGFLSLVLSLCIACESGRKNTRFWTDAVQKEWQNFLFISTQIDSYFYALSSSKFLRPPLTLYLFCIDKKWINARFWAWKLDHSRERNDVHMLKHKSITQQSWKFRIITQITSQTLSSIVNWKSEIDPRIYNVNLKTNEIKSREISRVVSQLTSM